jgi:membrane protein
MPPGDSTDTGLIAVAETQVASLSPEARRQRALRWQDRFEDARRQLHIPARYRYRALRVVRRIWAGVFNDGTIHAGNFAYMMLVSLFPFCITGAALFSLLGHTRENGAALGAVLSELPPVVAAVIAPVARGVLASRTGSLLWVGGLVGLWTVGSLVETIRDMLRRAYGTRVTRAYWRRRLASTGLIIASVVLILLAITVQVALGAAEETLNALAPHLEGWINGLALSRLAPIPLLFGALWLLFISLSPSAYRARHYPKWPGALFVTGWWQGITMLLPRLMRYLFAYDLTYGSLAGVMIALFFFWLVGLGMVVGAELNAALAETPEERDILGWADDPVSNREDRAANHAEGE